LPQQKKSSARSRRFFIAEKFLSAARRIPTACVLRFDARDSRLVNGDLNVDLPAENQQTCRKRYREFFYVGHATLMYM